MTRQTNFDNFDMVKKANDESPIKIGNYVGIKFINRRRNRPIINKFEVSDIEIYNGERLYDLRQGKEVSVRNLRIEDIVKLEGEQLEKGLDY